MNESLNNDFLDAVNRGDILSIRDLISRGANIEIKDAQGQTPLLILSKKGYLSAVRVLIEAGCDLKAKDHNNQNALHKVVLEGGFFQKESILSELLDTKQVGYDLKDDQGKSPLEYAKEKCSNLKYPNDTLEKILDVKCKDLLQAEDFDTLLSDQDLIIHLIKAGSPSISDLIDREIEINIHATGVCYKKPPLYYAFRNGHKDLFKKLIDKGADIACLELAENLPVNSNYPALRADCDMLDILTRLGFDINAQDEQGKSALHLALEYSQKDTAEALIKLGCDVNLSDNNGRYPLHKVMHAELEPADKILLIDLLFAHDAKVKVTDKQGKNPLHKAMEIYYMSPEVKVNIINRLLAKGIDINDRDCYGQTAFRKALDVYLNAEERFRHDKDMDVLDRLLANGADVNISDNNENTFDTIIFDAPPYSRWSPDLLQHILNKAEVNNPNHLGQNLLHIAAKHRNVNVETFENILQKYPDAFSCADKEGRLPLHLAVKTGGLERCSVFLEKFPDSVNICDNQGRIPLHYIHYGVKDMVKLLIKYGSKIDTPDKYGETPADKAAIGSMIDGLEELLDKGATFQMKEEFTHRPRNLLHCAIGCGATLTALYLIKNDFDILQENNKGLNSLSMAIEHNQTPIALALIDKDESSLPITMNKGKVPLDYAIEKRNFKVISKLLDFVPIDFKQFENLITIINKTDQIVFMRIMVKLLDPKTWVVVKDHRVYQEAFKKVSEQVDQFKKEKKEYSKLEDLRDIIKSLKNILNDPNYFDFLDTKKALMKSCENLLSYVEDEYSALSEDHFKYLLSKSGLDNSDANVIKHIIGYLKYEGHKLLEVSKSGIAIEGLTGQTQTIQDSDDAPEVQQAGTSIDNESEVTT
ncbi:hypothetical protein phytr_12060 [Candidatus Phycorickettsia trachydisci]|uniref:Uncharacterized protein n=1 Tax=Candidatus Phycorickettsia trachydisci TaxID=2115978 RepID=A0A2P1PA34_9RICK|nr:ankyrin repeat domain-containing protein [Candidatus Phycorickettsia trachydisci]AVP88131.1 hypothetical protein phytr_12060 [Candidatus Phycorickettsia trachydisci]